MRRLLVNLMFVSLLVLPSLAFLNIDLAQLPAPKSGENFSQFESEMDSNTVPAPGPDLGLVNWTMNRIANPDFEEWNTQLDADEWGEYAPGSQYWWFEDGSSNPAYVYEGAYSGGISAYAPNGRSASSYWVQRSLGADADNLSISFYWRLNQNLDPINDYLRTRVNFNDGRYLNYFLNGTQSYSNSTNSGTFFLDYPLNQWNFFSRNITADYLAIPLWPGTIDPSLTVENIFIDLYADGYIANNMVGFLDDFQLINETNGYVWVGGTTRNGNLNDPVATGWGGNSGRYDAAIIEQNSAAYRGLWSMNLTSPSKGNTSLAFCYQTIETQISSENHGVLRFWWFLNFESLDTYEFADVYFYCLAPSSSFYLHYILGHAGVSFIYPNSTWDTYFFAPAMNTTGSWVFFERDVWADMHAARGFDSVVINSITCFVQARNSGGKTSLLIDSMNLEASAINGGNHEDQPPIGQHIQGWGSLNHSQLTVTGTAYSGSKAANITLSPFSGLTVMQNIRGRPLNGSRETYLDLMWRIEDFSALSGNFIDIDIQLENGKHLSYYFATVSMELPPNSTLYANFNVTNVGSQGSWLQLHRDLNHDYEAVFGSLPDTKIVMAYIDAVTSGGGRVEFLFDDLYLYDDPAPRISNVVQNPPSPIHNDPVQISAEIEDQDLDADALLLHYRINAGGWQTQTLLHQTGVTFTANIPSQVYATNVEYYLSANDTWGLRTIALDGGSYWSYTVTEVEDPVVSITQPTSGAELNDTIMISVDASDTISGIAHVEIFIDGTSVADDTTAPYTYSWDTTSTTDGSHTILATAYDTAGNSASDSITVTVTNQPTTTPPPPPIPGFPIEAILFSVIAGITFGLLRRRRKIH